MSYMTLIALGIILLTGCDKDDESEDSTRVDTYLIAPPFAYGEPLLPLQDGRAWEFNLSNYWRNSSGMTFNVFILQDGNFKSVGRIHCNEKKITNAATLHINVPIPNSIDVNRSYQMIAIDNQCDSKLSNGKITFEVNLDRGTDAWSPGLYVARGGDGITAQSYFASACEFLDIRNDSGKKIKVKLKGYETSQKWYFAKGIISINSNLNMEATGSYGDGSSPIVEITAGGTKMFFSTYAATGNKMTNACAVLEIDGKEVKTPQASSPVTIENGGIYVLRAKWDGENLEWY